MRRIRLTGRAMVRGGRAGPGDDGARGRGAAIPGRTEGGEGVAGEL